MWNLSVTWRTMAETPPSIIAAPHFLFNLDWLVEHEIRLENPFRYCIFRRLCSLGGLDRVGTDDMSIPFRHNFYHP